MELGVLLKRGVKHLSFLILYFLLLLFYGLDFLI